jgi:hypothetical protein
MYSIIATLVLGIGAVFYFIKIGKDLQRGSSLGSALKIHSKINREKVRIEKEHRKALAKKAKGKPRDFFRDPDNRGYD